MKQHHLIALFAVFILVLPLSAETVTPSEAEQVVLTHLAGQQMTWNSQVNQGLCSHEIAIADYTIRSVNPVTDEESENTLFYVFHLWPEGFIVVSTDTALQPIVAYSYYGAFPMENTPGNTLLRMLQSDMRLRWASLPAMDERIKTVNHRNWAALLNNPPEVQTVEQWPPVEHLQYNNGWLTIGALPLDTSPMAHIDNYWKTVFPFALPGSGVDEGVGVLKTIHRCDSTREVMESTSPLFFNTLTENMRKGWPAQLEIQPGNGHGPLFVISDGYRLTAPGDSYYHLDFGRESGIPGVWYALPQGMSPGFSIVNSAVLDIHPTHDLHEPNNTRPEAYPIMDNDFNGNGGVWKTQSHTSMKTGNDRDWYRFEAKSGDELTITSRVASGGLIEVALYKGAELIETGEHNQKDGEIGLSHHVSVPGTYFVAVGHGDETPVEEVVNYGLQIERFRETPEQKKAPAKVLASLYISGPSSVNEHSGTSYTATAYYTDDTSANVSDYASWSENSIYAEFEGGHIFVTEYVTSNQTVTVSASYSSGGVSRTANKTVTIVNIALDYITVSGPASLMENTSANYTATAHFTNGSTSTVTASASWSENSGYATMSGNTLSAGTVSSNQTVRVTASYTNGGITRSDYVDVVIINYALSYVVITGPPSVWEYSSGTYYAYAYFTDGSVQNVTYSSSFYAAIYSGIMAGNTLLAGQVSQNQFGSVFVTYTYNGVTRGASMGVTIINSF